MKISKVCQGYQREKYVTGRRWGKTKTVPVEADLRDTIVGLGTW